MNGLAHINIELTSRCNKECWMCGRRKMDLSDLGDMSLGMVSFIAKQIPRGVVVQLHWNGEPTLYERLGDAIVHFRHTITQFDTNGKLLMEKQDDIIGNLDVLTISVIQDDPEAEHQKEIVKAFVALKGNHKPLMVYRLLGKVDAREWSKMPGVIAKRVLHAPEMSKDYAKPVTKPEIGICLDLLHSMAIDRYGNVSACVRFDPEGIHRIGHVERASLSEIWNSQHTQKWHDHPRLAWVQHHKEGNRHEVPLCKTCDYWGCPVSS